MLRIHVIVENILRECAVCAQCASQLHAWCVGAGVVVDAVHAVMKFLVLAQFVSTTEEIFRSERVGANVRIGEFLIAFQTGDELFVVGVLLQHVLFEIGFSGEDRRTVRAMELLGVGLMGEHVRFQTVALRESKFANLRKKEVFVFLRDPVACFTVH